MGEEGLGGDGLEGEASPGEPRPAVPLAEKLRRRPPPLPGDFPGGDDTAPSPLPVPVPSLLLLALSLLLSLAPLPRPPPRPLFPRPRPLPLPRPPPPRPGDGAALRPPPLAGEEAMVDNICLFCWFVLTSGRVWLYLLGLFDAAIVSIRLY